MKPTQADLEAAISTTVLAGREIVEVPILDTGEVAYAIKISKSEIESTWRAARSVFHVSGLWPVVTMCWGKAGSSADFSNELLEADLFSRFFYEEAPVNDDVSPRAICARADIVDPKVFLANKAARVEADIAFDETVAYELENVQLRCGSAPTLSEIEQAEVNGEKVASLPLLELWLKQWEEKRGFKSVPKDSRQSWFEDDGVLLLFLPVKNGWDSLAYLNFYGAQDYGTEHYIALGRSWERRFGAELVAHFGTMLQCLVSRPPTNFESSWQLALEHDLAADCTLSLPGIALRDYADALIGWDRWFLHERP